MASQSVDNSNLANTGKYNASLLLLGAVKRVLFGVGADTSQTDFMSLVCFTCVRPSSETVTKKTGRASHAEGCFCHGRKACQEELINFVDVVFFYPLLHRQTGSQKSKKSHPEMLFSYFRVKVAKTVSFSKYTDARQAQAYFYLKRGKEITFTFITPPHIYILT